MSENKNENKITFLIVALLIVVILLQVLHLIKLHEISLSSQLTNLSIYGSHARRDFRDEMIRLRDDERNIRHHLARRRIAKNMQDTSLMIKNQNYDEKNQVYTLEIAVPKNLKKDDIAIDFKNNTLGIAFGGFVEMQNQENTMTDNFAVYRFFETPETKAELKDIKYDLNNGLLKIEVPIIK